MRVISVSGTVLIGFLWSVAAFAFVGHVYTAYDEAAVELRDSGVRAVLTDLRGAVQARLDAGTALQQTERLQPLVEGYAEKLGRDAAVSVFETASGKVLYGSKDAAVGTEVPFERREKCKAGGAFFWETGTRTEIVGTPVVNALGQTVGCLTVEYPATEDVRDQMTKNAYRAMLRLSVIGFAGAAVFYLLSMYGNKFPFGCRQVWIGALTVLAAVLCAVPTVSRMTLSFEQDLKPVLVSKAGIVARTVKEAAEKAVSSGIPFEKLAGTDTFLAQVRKQNPEILFVLLTDKSGRVLFENGDTLQAFETSARTGAVVLKEGYFNAAEPVAVNSAAVGWVQIGVNERFVREKIF